MINPKPVACGEQYTYMALLTPEDIQAALNIDLTDPNGQALATSLIVSAVAFVETALGYPIEQRQQVTYFDGEYPHVWLPTGAPVSDVVIASYNLSTQNHDDIQSQYFRNTGTNEVYVSIGLPHGFQSVRATYTTGWTPETLPADLKQVLIDLVGLKLQEVTNYSSSSPGSTSEVTDASSTPTGGLKKFSAGSYSEEYSTAESDAYWKNKSAQLSMSIGDSAPTGIMNIIERYKRPFAI